MTIRLKKISDKKFFTTFAQNLSFNKYYNYKKYGFIWKFIESGNEGKRL
jgi:hypothetical protein